MLSEWNGIKVLSSTSPDPSYTLSEGDPLRSEVVLDLGGLKTSEIGVEMLFTTTDAKGRQHIQEVTQFEFVSRKGSVAKFRATVLPERTGMYQVGMRIYPKNPLLPHRQDFPLVKWL